MKRYCVLILLFFLSSPIFPQEISAKKDLAVFHLKNSGYRIPNQMLEIMDEAISDVFINIGRFNVIGMNYHLSVNDINEFIEKIREYKGENITLPESVLLGEEAFTEGDFNKLAGSFIVVVPSISYYTTERLESGGYRTDIKTAFTLINVEELTAFHHFTIETMGYDPDTPNKALLSAANDMPIQLTYEIRKIPVFQLKAGIIDVMGGNILIELGKNMGVKKGDEYAITKSRILESGHTVIDDVGLLVIKEVKESVSIARLIYSKGKPVVGEQVREVSRVGFDTSVSARVVVNLQDPLNTVVLLGIKESISRGFYTYRPIIGVEVPLLLSGTPGFPLNISAGGEINWYFRRLQIIPSATVGVGGFFPYEAGGTTAFVPTNAGFAAGTAINVLLGTRVRLFLEGGYTYWFGIGDGTDYGGAYAGLGAQVKY